MPARGSPGYGFDLVAPAPRPFGVVVPDPMLAWHAAALDWLSLVPGAELATVIQGGSPGRSPAPQRRARALRPVAAAPRGAPVGAAPPELEFVLAFGGEVPAAAAELAPRLGVWSFAAGLEWAGLRAIAAGDDVVAVALRAEAGRGGARRAGAFRVSPHSLAATVDRILFGAAAFPALALRDAALGAAPAPEPVEDHPGSGRPGLAVRARRLGATAAALGRWLRYAATQGERWNVGVFDGSMADFLAAGHPRPVRWLPAPPGHLFRADPFPYPGEDIALLEEWDDRVARGRIAAIDMAGSALPAAGLADPAVHQSYPYVFAADGRVHCVPETAEARRVSRYVAAGPGRWERVGDLLTGVAAIDSTVVRHDGRWWLFCTDRDVDDRGQLFVWHADALEGPWRPHSRNPVVVDPRSARPAGTPVEVDGALHRPAQDCARSYGRRVLVQRITRLTPDEYAEETAAVVEPDPGGPYPDGLHTIASDGRVTLVDGRKMTFRPLAAWHHARIRMRARRFDF